MTSFYGVNAPVYQNYATIDDVATFIGKAPSELPANTNAMIKKASDLLTNSIRVWIDLTLYPYQADALKNATCAQVEYWLDVSDKDENAQQVQSYSAGSVSVNYKDKPEKKICQRARGYLNRVGLLYKGVMTNAYPWPSDISNAGPDYY